MLYVVRFIYIYINRNYSFLKQVLDIGVGRTKQHINTLVEDIAKSESKIIINYFFPNLVFLQLNHMLPIILLTSRTILILLWFNYLSFYATCGWCLYFGIYSLFLLKNKKYITHCLHPNKLIALNIVIYNLLFNLRQTDNNNNFPIFFF